MRRLAFSIAVLVVATGAFAEVLLDEDFDDGVADGFGVWSGTWSVVDGVYVGQAEGAGFRACTYAGELNWNDIELTCDVRVEGAVNHIVHWRMTDFDTWYAVNVRSETQDAFLFKSVDGTRVTLAEVGQLSVAQGAWHQIRVWNDGPQMVIFFDGELLFEYTDLDAPLVGGYIGLIAYSGESVEWQDASFDNVLVTSLTVATESTTWGGVKALFE